MKKTLVSLVLLTLLLAIVKPASAHRWRSGLVPFAAGAATGTLAVATGAGAASTVEAGAAAG